MNLITEFNYRICCYFFEYVIYMNEETVCMKSQLRSIDYYLCFAYE